MCHPFPTSLPAHQSLQGPAAPLACPGRTRARRSRGCPPIWASHFAASDFSASELKWTFWIFHCVFAGTAATIVSGAIGAMITSQFRFRKPDVSMALNGVLAGLMAITAGCSNVSVPGSLLIGLLAGVLVALSVEFIDKVLKIDDPIGAVNRRATPRTTVAW